MKVPCKTEWCKYWVWPKSKSWLCDRCYRHKKSKEWRENKKLLLNNTIMSDNQIQTCINILKEAKWSSESLKRARLQDCIIDLTNMLK